MHFFLPPTGCGHRDESVSFNDLTRSPRAWQLRLDHRPWWSCEFKFTSQLAARPDESNLKKSRPGPRRFSSWRELPSWVKPNVMIEKAHDQTWSNLIKLEKIQTWLSEQGLTPMMTRNKPWSKKFVSRYKNNRELPTWACELCTLWPWQPEKYHGCFELVFLASEGIQVDFCQCSQLTLVPGTEMMNKTLKCHSVSTTESNLNQQNYPNFTESINLERTNNWISNQQFNDCPIFYCKTIQWFWWFRADESVFPAIDFMLFFKWWNFFTYFEAQPTYHSMDWISELTWL